MAQQLFIRFHDAQSGTASFAAKPGAINKVPVGANVHVELTDGLTGRGPKKVLVVRKGNDLLVRVDDDSTQGGEATDIILEGYYPQVGCQLLGLNEQGQYAEYVPLEPNTDHSFAILTDGDATHMGLNGAAVDITAAPGACAAPLLMAGIASAAVAGAWSPWLLGAIGLGATAAIAGGGGGGGDSRHVLALPATPLQAPAGYIDNVGAVQNANSTAPLTDDRTPGLHVGALPEGVTAAVLYVDGVIAPATYDVATGTLTPVTALPDGPHALGYGWRNDAGTTPSSPTISVAIDTTAPTAPVFVVTDPDGNGRPNISGTGEPGGTVTITDPSGGKHIAQIDPAGRFDFEIDMPTVPRGDWTGVVTDPVGNVGAPANVTLAILAPTVINSFSDDVGPIRGQIANGTITDDDRPALAGKAAPGTTVVVRDGISILGMADADSTGYWSFTPTEKLANGSHSWSATVTDPFGNAGLATTPITFQVDTQGPTTLTVIASALDDQGAVKGPLISGSQIATDDARPTFSGTAEANTTVVIKDGDNPIGVAAVSDTGAWTFTPELPLHNGVHHVTATAMDAIGNHGMPSAAFDFESATGGVPTATAITGVVDDVGLVANIAPNGLTNDARPTVSGTAQPDAVVTLVSETNTVLGTTTAGPNGQWSITPSQPLSDGMHTLTATTTTSDGDVISPTGPYQIVVDARAPDLAVVSLVDNVGPLTGPITQDKTTDDPTPVFSGAAEPGSTVTVRDGASFLGTVDVDPTGHWSFTPTEALVNGPHAFTATVTDPAGNDSQPTTPVNFFVDKSAVMVAINKVMDKVGDIAGPLEVNNRTDDPRPTVSGIATPGGLVTLYREGNVVLGSVVADKVTGEWSIQPTLSLTEGPHDLSSTVTTLAAGQSKPTDAFTIVVDVTPPAAPLIMSATDDVGPIKGALTSNMQSDDSTPTLFGTAEPGSKITVLDSGQAIGTTTTDDAGNWQFTPSPPLNQGSHGITAIATDVAGNPSQPSLPWTAVVDTSGMHLPDGTVDPLSLNTISVTGITTDTGVSNSDFNTSDTMLIFRGTSNAPDGSKVEVVLDGKHVGYASVTAGTWSFDHRMQALDSGEYSLRADLVDPSGNIAKSSGVQTLVIDPSGTTLPQPGNVTDPLTLRNIAVTGITNDTGVSASDFITTDTSLVFSGTSDALDGSNVAVWLDNATLGATMVGYTTVNGGVWSLDSSTTTLAPDTYSIYAQLIDLAGGVAKSSASQVLVIDASTPPTPKITSLIDDRGLITGSIADGSTTDDATPTFSGTADPGSIVTVLDQGVPIGTTVTNGSGVWSFTPPLASALTEGAHSLSATASGPSGQASSPTATIDFTVDLTPPAAKATVVAMGKDSGADSQNFSTNNIDAGRGVYGMLSAPLSAGETVQVTTDGGATWRTPVISGSHWTMVDRNLHYGSWVIQSRVVDSVGNVTVFSQSVALDETAPNAPSSVTLAGNQLSVALAGSVAAGATVNVAWGDHRIDQTLTASDITAGVVRVTIPTGYLAELPVSYGASLVDAAGNASTYASGPSGTVTTAVQHVDASSNAGYYAGTAFTNFVLDDTSYFSQSNSGIHGGTGYGILTLSGAGQVLDLAALTGFSDATKISRIEQVDLTGTGNNTLRLSVNDVLNLGNTAAHIADAYTQMLLKGNVGDTVVLSGLHDNGTDPGTWVVSTVNPTAVVNGVYYNVYVHSQISAEVLVMQQVGVSIVI